jgi:hypothetical protein
MILLQTTNETIINIADREFLMLYVPVIIWMVLIIVLFIFLLKHYTFRKWGAQPNPYHGETLGMPRGVIRATLSISLLFFVLLFETFSLSIETLEARTENLFTAFELMVAFYFGGKVMHHLSASDKKKNRDVANVIRSQQKSLPQERPEEEDALG